MLQSSSLPNGAFRRRLIRYGGLLLHGVERHHRDATPVLVVRWIGIWFDRELTFKQHVITKAAASHRALNALMRLSNTECGMSPPAVRQLYLACVVPVGDFGSEIWWKDQIGLANKLKMVQNTAAQRIMGAFRTTPRNALRNEAALPPIHIRLDYAQARYAVRLLTLNSTHPVVLRCPDTFPVPSRALDDSEAPEDTPGFRKTRLGRIISTLDEWLGPATEVEECAVYPTPWTRLPCCGC